MKKTQPQKSDIRIAAVTMARNDEFFLNRWIKYYGGQIGSENLYIYLDGLDQKIPSGHANANITKLPHRDEERQRGDKTRILLLSDLIIRRWLRYRHRLRLR